MYEVRRAEHIYRVSVMLSRGLSQVGIQLILLAQPCEAGPKFSFGPE